jgi:L-lactate dehydrogenase complex protein LldG
MGMTGRDAMLGRIRTALGRGALSADQAAAVDARLASHTRNLVPARAQIPHAEKVALFEQLLRKAGATVDHAAGAGDVPGAIARFLASHNLPKDVTLAPDARLTDLPWETAEPLLTTRAGKADPADLTSVTPVFAGIAETGTLMLVSGEATPSTLNLLPDNHIAVVRMSEIVGSMEDGWDRLRATYGEGEMPRTAIFITGPSRTADIELTMIFGAHGPRRLHVVLVGN